MGNNVSMNLSNADETGNSPQMMDLFNSLKTEITELKNDNVNFKNEITELKNDNVNFKNEITPLNGKISFLEKECLYSKLENLSL
jgi:predicted  nucleic acid-binding Zn-ribbon protein